MLLSVPGDLTYAVRTWRRAPGFAAVAALSLAVGIGLNTTVFSIINAIFFAPLRGVPDAARVVTLSPRVSFTTFRHVRENATNLGHVAAWQPMPANIRLRDTSLRRTVPVVSESYFLALDLRPARGRFFNPSPGRTPPADAEAVLDYEFWTAALGGDPAVLGETVHINNAPVTVVGVAPRAFHGFGPERPPLWVSMGVMPALRHGPARWEHPGESGWRVFGRLAADSTVGDVNAELRALAAADPSSFPAGALVAGPGGEPVPPASPEKRIEFLLVVVLPLVIVTLILWVGCSNVANLLLARGAARGREIAIRLANGAGTGRILQLLLTESLLLAAAGGAAGLILAAWTLDLVWATLPDVPRLAVEIDVNVLLYTAAVCVVATLFFGLAPALNGARVDLAPLLRGEGSGTGRDRRGRGLRTFFLVTQFACSAAILIAAGTLAMSLLVQHGGSGDAPPDHLTIAHIDIRDEPAPLRQAYWSRVRDALVRTPGVVSATVTPPGSVRELLAADETIPPGPQAEVTVHHIDPSFFRTVGAQLLTGRDDLHAGERAGARAIVNERAARQFWGAGDVAGRRFSLGTTRGIEIAAVIRDDGAEPRVFRPLGEEALATGHVIIRTAGPAARAIGTLRASLDGVGRAGVVTRIATVRDAATGGLQRLTAMALGLSAIVLALATVGLYGSVSFATAQRTRELAVRLALGATRPAVLRHVARDALRVVLGGSLIGLGLAAVSFRYMSGMIVASWTLEPAAVAFVLITLGLATFLACYFPARRAMRIEPMAALRSE